MSSCAVEILERFYFVLVFTDFSSYFPALDQRSRLPRRWSFAVYGHGHLWHREYNSTPGPSKQRIVEHKETRPRRLHLHLAPSEGAGAVWPLTFSIPQRCLWVLNGGLRGAEARAWFSRVKTKRLLKIPKSSHDPRKDLDPTCVGFPFLALGHTESTYLADLFSLVHWMFGGWIAMVYLTGPKIFGMVVWQ